MKGYYGIKRMRLVGKGWEVREKLRRMRREATDPSMTLDAWLRNPPALRPAESPTPARSPSASSAAADFRSYPMA
ncbi:MAG TPA: Z-ring formation inhibitor MciZ [Paenibacillus sp.]|nr:Z-ring formation inhibitor MciZ [Paenibacillus sp.]